MVTVPKAEFESLQDAATNSQILMDEMAKKLDQLQSAMLAGVGTDPVMAARHQLPYKMVQFTDNYARLPIASSIQKGAIVIEGFNVSKLEIVEIREDEFNRIMGDQPSLMQPQKNKWLDMPSVVAKPDADAHGRLRYRMVNTPIKVDDLVKRARKVG